jgi:APA family basic amino acid/polyamine antiporter
MIAASTIFVFRVREPNIARPYRAWGYPVMPALFVVAAAVLLYFTFIDKLHRAPVGTLVMTLVILSGVPVFWWFVRQKKASTQ